MHLRFAIAGVVLLALTSCLTLGTSFKGLPPGIWRGILILAEGDDAAEERAKAELPFNFEVIYDRPDSFHIEIRNGTERIIVRDIRMGVDRRTGRDTVWIDFPLYDAHIRAQYEEDALEGYWVVRNRKEYQIRFKALHGQAHRFLQLPEPPAADVSGHWLCQFGLDTGKPDTMIGDFQQEGNALHGTFLSPTGDFRYLEGTVSGDRMFLSVFDGSHAYLFEAKILADGKLSGIYRSGNHYKTYWEGERTTMHSSKDIANPYTLTRMRSDVPFTLTLPDTDGKLVSVHAPPYAGRPRILQVMGTWCPNCKDETEFLLNYLKVHPNPGFDVIGISFERHTDSVKAIQAIRTYKDKMGIPYPILIGGTHQKDKAGKVLSMLENVVAYPTLIFLRPDGHVDAIHTGFSGPATDDYAEFMKDFDHYVLRIITTQ